MVQAYSRQKDDVVSVKLPAPGSWKKNVLWGRGLTRNILNKTLVHLLVMRMLLLLHAASLIVKGMGKVHQHLQQKHLFLLLRLVQSMKYLQLLYHQFLLPHPLKNIGPEGWRLRQRHFETVTSLVRSCWRFFPSGSALEIWSEFRYGEHE